MKNLAIAKGAHGYLCPNSLVLITPNRFHVVPNTELLRTWISNGLVDVHDEKLNDDATDAEFEAYLIESEGDADLAVASFISAYSADPEKVTKDLTEVKAVKPAKVAKAAKAAEAKAEDSSKA